MSSVHPPAPGFDQTGRTPDRSTELGTILLHIAVSSPSDAAELARRIPRPRKAIHDDIRALMGEGTVHVHGGSLRTSLGPRLIAQATASELREIYDQVLAEVSAGTLTGTATLVALAESGCTDEALLHLLVRAVGEHPGDASIISALAQVARAIGHTDLDVNMLRATDAAHLGHSELVLGLTDSVLSTPGVDTAIMSRAAVLAAGAHVQHNRLSRAVSLVTHIGAEMAGADAVWAVVAATGMGDPQRAAEWQATLQGGLTNRAAGLSEMAEGLMLSLQGNAEGSLGLLARSVSTLSPLGASVVLPESPAALAAMIACGRGEPETAEMILGRAQSCDLGGASVRQRHLLLTAWALMVQGRMSEAEGAINGVDPQSLPARDALLFWSLRAGLGRRNTDITEMRTAWREVQTVTLGMTLGLTDLLPLGELLVVAARLRDSERVAPLLAQATRVLTGLGHPAVWAVPLHWHGVQAALTAEDPNALIQHANALVRAEQVSPYAATLAEAGNTWLGVLRRELDFGAVERSTRALASSGHVWDASRLAGQAALQYPERDEALSMMQLARDISKDHHAGYSTQRTSSVLTVREAEVARLVLDGHGYKAVGEQLFISPKTVEHHVARMRSRLGATSRAELLEKLHDELSPDSRNSLAT